MIARRGALLLEILIALSLFVTAGSIILVSTTSMTASLARSRDRQIAADLAVSKMAALEAGLATAEQLNDSLVDVELFSESEVEFNAEMPQARWRLVVETEPSRFSPLTNVTIRVLDARSGSVGNETELAVLHQLIRLNASAPEEFESDPLLNGAPPLPLEGGGG